MLRLRQFVRFAIDSNTNAHSSGIALLKAATAAAATSHRSTYFCRLAPTNTRSQLCEFITQFQEKEEDEEEEEKLMNARVILTMREMCIGKQPSKVKE